MKLLRLALFVGLMIITSACSFNTQVITPEPTAVTESTLVIEPSPISSATLVPTSTFAPTLPSTPVPVNVDTIPIRFAPNGTYLDLVDSISTGTSKTYTVSASKGQIMSVSVKLQPQTEWSYLTMRLTGTDGAILCSASDGSDCGPFWRGVLPSTQEYQIRLTSAGAASNFTLRVAVNPPGVQTQSFQYVSSVTGARFSYTDEFAPVRTLDIPLFKFTPEFALFYIGQDFAGSNFSEGYLSFGSSTDAALVPGCLDVSPLVSNEHIIDTVNINGRQFTHSAGNDAGSNQRYEHVVYRTIQNATCYEIQYFIHSFNPEVFLPQRVIPEYDHTALLNKFGQALSTFVLP